MSKAGRKPILTPEITFKIRDMVFGGMQYVDIQKELDISPDTWDGWVYRDYKGFRDNLQSWKHEMMIRKAEQQLDSLITSENEKVSLKASEFVLSRLNKKKYSERLEQTGADGKDLIPSLEEKEKTNEAINSFLNDNTRNT